MRSDQATNSFAPTTATIVAIFVLLVQPDWIIGIPTGTRRMPTQAQLLDRRSLATGRLPVKTGKNNVEENAVPVIQYSREPRARGKIADTWLDKIDVSSYLRNTRAVNLQIDCLLKDAVCDSVGKSICFYFINIGNY